MFGSDISKTSKIFGRIAGLSFLLLAGAGVPLANAQDAEPTEATAAQTTAAIDPEAMRQQGEAMVYSVDPEVRDVAGGIALLERSAAEDNTRAKLTLGEIYLYDLVIAQDLPRALGYFEEVAAKGDGAGIAQYGMMLMWGEKDWKLATDYLLRATELGTTSAWATLAEGAMFGYLGGGKTSRKKFDGYAERGRAANVARIEVLDSIRLMYGINMVASGPKTIEKLQAAAATGNAEAAKYLVSLQRDGNDLNIRRDLEGAQQSLVDYSKMMSTTEIWQYNVSLQAARARNVDAYEAVAAEIRAHPELVTKPLGVQLQQANENAAIYVLQGRLKARGLYDGPLNGQATRRTMDAMYKGCDRLLDRKACEDSVMRPDVIAALLTAK